MFKSSEISLQPSSLKAEFTVFIFISTFKLISKIVCTPDNYIEAGIFETGRLFM